MSEEEQEAIEYLKNKHILTDEYCAVEDYETEDNIKIVLNLISKLQKENEELKNEKEPVGEFFMSKNGVVIKVIDNREEKEGR